MPEGSTLRVQTAGPATVLWAVDGASAERLAPTRDTTLGVWLAELDTASLPAGAVVRFGIRDGAGGAAVDHGHAVTVVAREKAPAAARRRAAAT